MKYRTPDHDNTVQALPEGKNKWILPSDLRYDDVTDTFYVRLGAPLGINNGQDQIRISKLYGDLFRIDLTRSNEARVPHVRGDVQPGEMAISIVHRTMPGRLIRRVLGAPVPVS